MITWDELPPEIQNRMLECQEEQGNPRNPEVFIKRITMDKFHSGFHWSNTIEGNDFWYSIIFDRNIDVFYEKYPKKTDLSIKIEKIIKKLEQI